MVCTAQQGTICLASLAGRKYTAVSNHEFPVKSKDYNYVYDSYVTLSLAVQ